MANRVANIKDRGVKFSSTYQPANRGRKPSLFRKLVEQWNGSDEPKPSKADYHNMIAYLMERTTEELTELYNEASTPVWVKTIISAMREDMACGRMVTINALFDRVLGKPSAEVDATFNLRGSVPIRAWVEDRLKKKR